MAESTRRDRTLAYTHDWYRSILSELDDRGYRFERFGGPPVEGAVYLRHDVDLSLSAAVELARLEADAGATATYFVQLGSPLYNPFERDHRRAIREIADLGHEVGLHFHAAAHFDGEPSVEALRARVRDEQTVLETIVPDASPAVSFHIPPEWALDRSFSGLTSAYEPQYFSEIEYVADSSGRWRDEPPETPRYPAPFQLLTHPGLWATADAPFATRVEDAAAATCHRIREAANRQFMEGADV